MNVYLTRDYFNYQFVEPDLYSESKVTFFDAIHKA